MSDLRARLIDLAAGHVSRIIARSIVNRALSDHRGDLEKLSRDELRALRVRLESAIQVFAEPAAVDAFSAELVALLGDQAKRRTVTLPIRSERDLAEALSETRRMCDEWQVRALARQRIATVVSELGRNIVSYTPGGVVELIPIEGAEPRVLVRASDSGTGIPNLDAVLAGRYKSKTGLGKGLIGCERLSHRFDVRSGRAGTTIEAELEL